MDIIQTTTKLTKEKNLWCETLFSFVNNMLDTFLCSSAAKEHHLFIRSKAFQYGRNRRDPPDLTTHS